MRACLVGLLLFATCRVLAQSGEFRPGWYYDKSGGKISGFLNTSEIFSHLKFKTTLDESEFVKIKLSKFDAFVTGTDSFTVIRNFKVESEWSNYTITATGVGKVLEVGNIILYEVYYMGRNLNGSATMSSGGSQMAGAQYVYVIKQKGTDKAIGVEKGIDDFVLQMNTFFRMNPELCERIRKKEFSYLKVQQLVHEYNEWYRNR